MLKSILLKSAALKQFAAPLAPSALLLAALLFSAAARAWDEACVAFSEGEARFSGRLVVLHGRGLKEPPLPSFIPDPGGERRALLKVPEGLRPGPAREFAPRPFKHSDIFPAGQERCVDIRDIRQGEDLLVFVVVDRDLAPPRPFNPRGDGGRGDFLLREAPMALCPPPSGPGAAVGLTQREPFDRSRDRGPAILDSYTRIRWVARGTADNPQCEFDRDKLILLHAEDGELHLEEGGHTVCGFPRRPPPPGAPWPCEGYFPPGHPHGGPPPRGFPPPPGHGFPHGGPPPPGFPPGHGFPHGAPPPPPPPDW